MIRALASVRSNAFVNAASGMTAEQLAQVDFTGASLVRAGAGPITGGASSYVELQLSTGAKVWVQGEMKNTAAGVVYRTALRDPANGVSIPLSDEQKAQVRPILAMRADNPAVLLTVLAIDRGE
jgi:hypothetical protein